MLKDGDWSTVPSQISEADGSLLGVTPNHYKAIVARISQWSNQSAPKDKLPQLVEASSRQWKLITEFPPPRDDRKFLVGAYVGEQQWNDEYTSFFWVKGPVWLQAISHHENPNGPNKTRGWNHRNGPLPVTATHWKDLDEAPPIDEEVLS